MFPASPRQGWDGCPLVGGSTNSGSTTDAIEIKPNLAKNLEGSRTQNAKRSLVQQAFSSLHTSECKIFTYFDILILLDGVVRELIRGKLKMHARSLSKGPPASFPSSAEEASCLRGGLPSA